MPSVNQSRKVPHPDAVRTGDGSGELRRLVRKGDRLQMVPGQIRVLNGERAVGLLTANTGLWSAERCWDAEEWQELATTAAHLARTESPTHEPEPEPAAEQQKTVGEVEEKKGAKRRIAWVRKAK